MKRILVPTDFSYCANKALDYAVCLAKKTGAEIMVVHACQLNHNPLYAEKAMVSEENSAIIKKGKRQLHDLQKSIQETENITVEIRFYDGDFQSTVYELSGSWKADVVVMGTTGKTGWQNRFFGSNTAAMLSESAVPVIVVPGAYEWTEPGKVLLALNDESEDANELKPAFDIAASFGAEVAVGLFSDEHEEAFEMMHDSRTVHQLSKKLQSVYHPHTMTNVHVAGRDFLEAMQTYIDAEGVDLLAMVTHKRKGLQTIFHKSLTREMNYLTKIPLLSIPHKG